MTCAPKFIIDSNILIESKNVDYGFDICPGFWTLMEKAEGLTLVTQEVSEPYSRKSIKLPDACNAIGVSCCNKYELLRALRARFVLDEAHSFA